MGDGDGGRGNAALQRLVRRRLRQNTFVALRDHDGAMPRSFFRALLVVLVSFRIYSLLCLFVAWGGWFLVPSFWATGQPIAAEHLTPFHSYPNVFGWRFGFQGFLIAHNITGWLLFALCLFPLFAPRGGPAHRWLGRGFVFVWLLHMLDGLSNSGQILIARGFDPTRYLDSTQQGFSLYLYIQFAFVSSLVIDFLAHGMAALQYKNRPPSRGTRALMLLLPATSLVFGLALALWGVVRLLDSAPPATPSTITYAVVFVVQVPAYIYLIVRNMLYWLRANARSWLHGWLMEHQRNMMFCVQVTLYTGAANATQHFAPYLTPYLFGAIDVGFLLWIVLKERALRRRVVSSRAGLALASALRGSAKRRRRPEREALSAVDQRWLARLFDLDGSGTLEINEVEALLTKQGIDVTADERERLRRMLDLDGDGRIDHQELASFLAEWLTLEPDAEDELALAFRALDRDGDGQVSAAELRAALCEGGTPLSDAEVDQIMESADLDKSGGIDWEEFVAALRGGAGS